MPVPTERTMLTEGTMLPGPTMLSPPARQTTFYDLINHPPETEKEEFSFRRLWAFAGPGFMMSIAYLDIGSIEVDMVYGITAEYKQLWLLLSNTVVGLFIHRLAARLGVVTGMHLAEMCYRQYHVVPRIILWLMTEVGIIAYGIQEVTGTSIALHLLSNKAIPLWGGVLIALITTCTFLLLDIYGLRKVELLFGFLIFVMAVSFGYEYRVVEPDQGQLLKGIFNPLCTNCETVLKGIFGSVAIPHNLYLYSALVKSRDVDRRKPKCIKEANWYFFIEACIALFISFIINFFVVALFAKGLFNQTNNKVRDHCIARNITHYDVFPENDELVNADIYSGGVFLGCYFRTAAMYIWAVGILASGLSSTMTGTYAGQFAMEGFLNLQSSGCKRTLLTRAITIVPTFFVASFIQTDDLTELNARLIVLMTMQLPFAFIPTIALTSNGQIMGEFANGIANTVISMILSVGGIFINLYYVVQHILQEFIDSDWLLVLLLYVFFYFVAFSYLYLHMLIYNVL